MDELDEIIKEFLVESYENLDQLDRDLVLLEDAPDDQNRLSSVFRTIHTIKGTCGFLGFPILEHVTHVGESLLVRLRDGELKLTPVITSGLLAMVDAVRTILANIANTQSEGDDQYEELVEQLETLQLGEVPEPVGAVVAVEEESVVESARQGGAAGTPVVEDTFDAMVADLNDGPAVVPVKSSGKGRKKSGNSAARSKPAGKRATGERSSRRPVAKKANVTVERVPVGASDSTVCRDVEPVKSAETKDDSPAQADQPVNSNSVAKHPRPVAGSGAEAEASLESQDKTGVVAETTVRLDVTLLDALMNLVGELVLVRNQILQYSAATDDAVLNAATQRLNQITTELQEGVMKTRMQPIQNAWAKLPRVVRDVSLICGKKVQIKMEGAETELDKTILEAIRDPLTHIVRNSVDHGIETPEVRKALGKPAEGTLLLRASHAGGQVHIEIGDDGGGINLPRVREKGIRQGLITEAQAAAMSERELMNLILLPGFSTATTVTSVSGRGVGMDVVKTNVEKIGGTLEIDSVYGQGTTLRMRIPLTLAIVPALMVSCDGDRYAIPQNNLVELVRLEGNRLRDIENIHDVPVYRLRNNLLPLLYLDEQLQLRPARKASELPGDAGVNIVVLNADGRQFGMVVDTINDTQEIVVKPLGSHLKDLATYAGVTIMGDGTAALILDVLGIAKRSGVVSEGSDRRMPAPSSNTGDSVDSTQTMLLMGVGDSQRVAIPLSLVARLEEITVGSIERAGGQPAVQYGGQIMPLFHLGELLNSRLSELTTSTMGQVAPCPHSWLAKVATEADPMTADVDRGPVLQVVVYLQNGRSIGLVVDQILDVVEASGAVQQTGRRLGVLGSAVIQNRVTDLLDIQNLILANGHNLFGTLPSSLAV